ncbi:hypothetical protein [Pyxidicoccus xibeiensis]|uniref:hypothetical protein n=1 Tax=Pyxidicoccus xibeiensis TaxID=2906759 RepID=UPI0020A79BE1|nr:hypothetical protein [Pyxidicoccus xibeiensis]MCP3137329.1 hypothetical protein [Pyxidicoccus xibeiensis]
MRARLVVLTGTLALALWAAGCDDDDNGPGPTPQQDAGVPVDPGDGGGNGRDGGPRDGGQASDFACNVARQEGCAAGQSCHFADLPGGGTGSRCFAAGCDVVRQDCGEGQRCTYVLQGSERRRACVPAGTVAEGAPCTLAPTDGGVSYDTCQQGLYCKDEPGSGGGRSFACRRLCHASPECGEAGECNTVLRLEGTTELPLVCGPPSARCDPFGEGCTSPLGCYPSTSGPVCAGIGTRGEGESCEFSNQCAEGSACVNPGSGLTCRALCRPSGTPACATGRCSPLGDNPGVGACVP